MEVRPEAFPIVVQAYDNTNPTNEVFLAEQVVNSQVEVDNFTTRFTGKLIKARALSTVDYENVPAVERTRRSSSAGLWLFLLLILIALVVVGFTTGWIQQNFNIHL